MTRARQRSEASESRHATTCSLLKTFELVSQTCTWVHVAFDDSAVAEFFDDQVDAGRKPEQFARIWIHTHPGKSAEPSGTDEATFTRVFGRSEWAVMFILARGGQTYARLRYNVGPGADVMLPVEVDYSRSFAASNVEAWKAEYDANVRVPPPELPVMNGMKPAKAPVIDDDVLDPWWGESWSNDGRFEDHQLEGEYGYIRDF